VAFIKETVMGTCGKSGSNNDRWLTEVVFPGKTDGFYLELGAGHWENESASYPLEELGWSGVSFEISKHLVDAFNDNRSNECFWFAVWTRLGTIDCVFPARNEFRAGVARVRNERQLKRDATQHARTSTIACIPFSSMALPDHIDAVVIDIEGAEKEVVPTFPFDSHTVGAWIIETASPWWLIELMASHGYKEVRNPLNTAGLHNRYFLPENHDGL
jgi:hypothetical protein